MHTQFLLFCLDGSAKFSVEPVRCIVDRSYEFLASVCKSTRTKSSPWELAIRRLIYSGHLCATSLKGVLRLRLRLKIQGLVVRRWAE